MQVHLLPIPNQVLTSLPVLLRWLLAHLVNVLSCDFTHSCSEWLFFGGFRGVGLVSGCELILVKTSLSRRTSLSCLVDKKDIRLYFSFLATTIPNGLYKHALHGSAPVVWQSVWANNPRGDTCRTGGFWFY